MKKHKVGLATKYILVVCLFLLAVNVILGLVLRSQSSESMYTLIRWHMLSVADTAAAAVDGDVLEALTENDVGSANFKRIAETLAKVINAQKDSDIKYIYATKKTDDGFVFTVDPDPVSPGAFGEAVVYTKEQDVAWEGTSAIETSEHVDKWGAFITAWSPVRNSHGKIIGLIGVDYSADWYEARLAAHSRLVILFTTLSVTVGSAIMILMTVQLRGRMKRLNQELSVLSDDVSELSKEIGLAPSDDVPAEPDTSSDADAIGVLSTKIRVIQKKLKEYIEFAHTQAYTDKMTGVGNKTAYLEYIKELGKDINEGTAGFAIAVFDINGLKNINDNYGHECGDRIITDAALLLKRYFTDGQIFRIGGDEFIVELAPTDIDSLNERFDEVQRTVDDFNANEKKYAMTLSFSGGGAVYRPGVDADYKEVFKRADEAMYKNKAAYYMKHGDRRREQ